MTLDIWAEFKIRSISPSHLKRWSEDRGSWYAQTRAKIYDDAGPAAWRGDAVEAGLHTYLIGRPNASAAAHQAFEDRSLKWSEAHEGEVHPRNDEYEEEIDRTLSRAISAFDAEGYKSPEAYQVGVECFLPRTRVQMWGKFDWAFSGFTVDLKTTGQLPSQPKDPEKKPEPEIDHAIAASCYALARGDSEARICYVSTAEKPKTPHRTIILGSDDIAFYTNAAAEIVKQIEATLWAAYARTEFECVDKETALAELCRPNPLAQGGGIFPVYRDEYLSRVRAAVPAWR